MCDLENIRIQYYQSDCYRNGIDFKMNRIEFEIIRQFFRRKSTFLHDTFRSSSDIVNPSMYSSKHLKIIPDSRTSPVAMNIFSVSLEYSLRTGTGAN